jgi:hypothetical protein
VRCKPGVSLALPAPGASERSRQRQRRCEHVEAAGASCEIGVWRAERGPARGGGVSFSLNGLSARACTAATERSRSMSSLSTSSRGGLELGHAGDELWDPCARKGLSINPMRKRRPRVRAQLARFGTLGDRVHTDGLHRLAFGGHGSRYNLSERPFVSHRALTFFRVTVRLPAQFPGMARTAPLCRSLPPLCRPGRP